MDHGFEAQFKRALVTGSTARIGFAIALGLAREGAEVAVNGRTDAKVNEAVKRIAGETKQGPSAPSDTSD
jgi:NAD(P)-dependent dehydrogenase (short-subunit alcohol dehydrogenase family)